MLGCMRGMAIPLSMQASYVVVPIVSFDSPHSRPEVCGSHNLRKLVPMCDYYINIVDARNQGEVA